MNADAGGSALVLLDGDYEDPGYYRRRHREARLVVAADGGLRFALEHGLHVDVLVGDFDSLDDADVMAAQGRGVRVQRHPVSKDQTDGELAIAAALAERPGEVLLAGALGGGLDHVLGHLALLLAAARRGATARLVSPRLTVAALAAPAAVALDAAEGTRVSVVPLGGDARVSLAGLAYPLEEGLLTSDTCLGLGNRVTGPGRVVVHSGAVGLFVFDGEERFGRRPEAGR